VHYPGTAPVRCDDRPIALDASHARLELVGACRHVRVTGEHNDVIVRTAPNGVIEVTGAHNDVWWRPAIEGTRPVLRSTSTANSFHRDEG
jgi:hypothetical protein